MGGGKKNAYLSLYTVICKALSDTARNSYDKHLKMKEKCKKLNVYKKIQNMIYSE